MWGGAFFKVGVRHDFGEPQMGGGLHLRVASDYVLQSIEIENSDDLYGSMMFFMNIQAGAAYVYRSENLMLNAEALWIPWLYDLQLGRAGFFSNWALSGEFGQTKGIGAKASLYIGEMPLGYTANYENDGYYWLDSEDYPWVVLPSLEVYFFFRV